MYIDIVPNRKSPPAILLRESVRQGQKIVKRTLANLSSLSIEQAHDIRRVLKGKKLVQPEEHFTILCSRPHGHVDAVLRTIRRLGLGKLITSRPCHERDLVISMIASRILCPQSKLALTRDLEKRVKTHLFLCILAYYVKWHMMEAWRPLLFADEDQQAKQTRDPVAPAKRSAKAEEKIHSKRLEDGSAAHSFQSLLRNLATIVRNTCQTSMDSNMPSFTVDTQHSKKQQEAFQLLQNIKM